MSLLAAVAITTAETFGTPSADAATAWVGGFETGNLSRYSTNEIPKSDSGVVMSSPTREGGKAAENFVTPRRRTALPLLRCLQAIREVLDARHYQCAAG